jgi:hypothetical protein
MTTSVLVAAAMQFVIVHGPNGQEISINSQHISSVRRPLDSESHGIAGMKCVVVMTNGKFIGTQETCPQLGDKIRGIE